MACNYLIEKGFEIVARNYRYKKAEIDIIAVKEKLLLFVEVKTRKSKSFGEPEHSVNQLKENLILSAAEYYLEMIKWKFDIRFDIIAIHFTQPAELFHIEDAFY
jgi:putative endonuclease